MRDSCGCGVRDIVSQVTLNVDIRDSYVGVEHGTLSHMWHWTVTRETVMWVWSMWHCLTCDTELWHERQLCGCGAWDIVSHVTLNCDMRDSYVGVEYVTLFHMQHWTVTLETVMWVWSTWHCLTCDTELWHERQLCGCGVRDIVSQVTLNCDIRDSYVGVEYVTLSHMWHWTVTLETVVAVEYVTLSHKWHWTVTLETVMWLWSTWHCLTSDTELWH